MAIENDPSARMQLRSAGELMAPAACAVCGSGNCEEGYLDLDCFVEFHGTVYLCMDCLTQAAETAGMYTRLQVEVMNLQFENLAAIHEATTSELENAKQLIASYQHILSTGPSADAGVPDDVRSENVEKPAEPAVSREPEVKKSTASKKSSGTRGTKLHDITFD